MATNNHLAILRCQFAGMVALPRENQRYQRSLNATLCDNRRIRCIQLRLAKLHTPNGGKLRNLLKLRISAHDQNNQRNPQPHLQPIVPDRRSELARHPTLVKRPIHPQRGLRALSLMAMTDSIQYRPGNTGSVGPWRIFPPPANRYSDWKSSPTKARALFTIQLIVIVASANRADIRYRR
ncbi:hypothetical protein KCP75_23940 [Salmonella enterica subsp. enterica]|nr:hypothetical protein KCP75_23940 [Salmonella enterica subsp. enterica]